MSLRQGKYLISRKVRVFSIFFGFLLSFPASACNSNGVHFYDIATDAVNTSLHTVLAKLELSSCFNASNRHIKIADNVQVGGESVYKEWYLSKYDERKKGFSINLNTGQYSFYLPSFRELNDIYVCQNNIASSGMRVIYIKGSVLKVAESWSCGTLGCAYEYLFSESTEGVKYFCENF